jgi:TonB family protein
VSHFETKLAAVRSLVFFVIISLTLHFLGSTSALYFANGIDTLKSNDTEIEIVENKPENLREQVEKIKSLVKQLQTTAKQSPDFTKKADFDSERDQRVEKQTRARNLGMSQNAIQQPRPPFNSVSEKKPENSQDGDLPEFARARPMSPSSEVKNSAISINLPSDIQESNATNLNTDASTYYSFYSRVEELFYIRWVERNNYYWSRIEYEYKKNVLAGKVWSTSLEVWLTSTGEYHSSYIKQSSGYKPFDEAAVYAFKNARFFPNPPRAKIEPDGYVRLRYRFNVHVAGI